MAKRTPPIERFWAKVDKTGDCWEWTGARFHHGYGLFYESASVRTRAHRFAYETLAGPIPPGVLVLHRCDNPPCVRPEHLFLGTQADNVADMIAKGRIVSRGNGGGLYGDALARSLQTHCIRGHPLSGANLYLRSSGHRTCRECGRARNRRVELVEN